MDKDMRIALVTSLFEKALRINDIYPRNKADSGDLPTVFVRFSGHIAAVTFEINENGWDAEEPEFRMSLHLDHTDGVFWACYKTISSRLDEVQKKAERTLKRMVAADA